MSEKAKRLAALREKMSEYGADAVYIPTADCHESEYPAEHYKTRRFITGFTGSAGTALVTADKAFLWTDGRYFIQAERELEGSTIELCRIGVDGVPTVYEMIEKELPADGTLFFDGSVVNGNTADKLSEAAKKRNGTVNCSHDIAGEIWTDRPPVMPTSAWILEKEYSGKSVSDKLSELRESMSKEGADVHILSSLDDVNWLFNVRGSDVPHFPVIYAFAAVTADKAILFAYDKAVSAEIRERLAKEGAEVRSYGDIYGFAEKLSPESKVLIDRGRTNAKILGNLPETAVIINKPSPVRLMKSKKNTTELYNLRKAHISDGAAVTKFIIWIKKNAGKLKIDEVSAADYLENLRRQQDGFLDLSFDTICAYKGNAAMMHYSAKPETAAEITDEGMLLVDSGGHYLNGSTDITRTIVLGRISDEEKRDFTAVLKSMLALARVKFLSGCTGQNLDILCRSQLWKYGIDYRCGTGHGVGYLLNIHEGPNSVHWGNFPGRTANTPFEEGMVTTDEPGVYIEGRYGIRTENELVCRKAEKNEYGQFMEFETITYAPIDLDGIIPEMLTFEEKEQLNRYHRMVYQEISPLLDKEEAEILTQMTREI